MQRQNQANFRWDECLMLKNILARFGNRWKNERYS